MSSLSEVQEQKDDGTPAVISQGDGLMESIVAALVVKPFSLAEINKNRKRSKLPKLDYSRKNPKWEG